MNSITLNAYAKLNLSLDIIGTLENGYHELEMVMQSVDLSDTVTVTKADEISVFCDDCAVPSGADNICYKIAEQFFSHTQIVGGAKINIQKRIPSAAGLGGGSADAAAALIGLNALFRAGLEYSELIKIAEEVGTDVPFCIKGGLQLATGSGTTLLPLISLPDCYFVVVKSGEKPSTAEMYRRFDDYKKSIEHPKTHLLIDCIEDRNLFDAAFYMSNVFEVLWGSDVRDIKQELCKSGALAACLSGSGPAVFGIFESEDSAKKCQKKLKKRYKNVFFCKAVNQANIIKG